MALNGLDSPDISQAHQETLAEPGGWFLLRYVSRDEVDLLARGSGGLNEVSIALAAYPDASPLYGFLHYRRRKVSLRYTPLETSRLLLARSGVHYQAFSDHFAHEAELSAAAPHEVCDAALSAVLTPHAARSTSLHSLASSVKRPNLDEIFEDAEETPRSAAHSVSELERRSNHTGQPLSNGDTRSGTSPVEMLTAKDLPSLPTLPIDDGFTIPAYPRDTSPQRSIDDYYRSPLSDTRPTTSESYKYDLDTWKPKEKARPRPVTDDKYKKASTNATSRAALPTGMRASVRRTDERPRSSKSQRSLRRANGDAGDTPPLPSAGERALGSPDSDTLHEFPATDRRPSNTPSNVGLDGAADDRRSLSGEQDTSQSTTAKQKAAPVSVEKQRLMKAMQLRKKQKELAKEAELAEAAQAPAPVPAAAPLSAPADVAAAPPASSGREEIIDSVPADGRQQENSPPVPVDSPTEDAHVEHLDATATSTVVPEPAVALMPSAPLEDRASAVEPALTDARIDEDEHPSAITAKRRPALETVKTNQTLSSEGGFQSDDSLLDELQFAKLENATSIEVPHGPRTPLGGTFQETTQNSGATSVSVKRSPPSRSPISPGAGRLSSMSQTSQETLALSKGRNVSSGISKRIQALADNSSRENSPAGQPRVESGPEVARSFLTIRNLASRPSSRDQGAARGSQASRASSPGRPNTTRPLNQFIATPSIQEERAKTSHGSPPKASAAESTITARIIQSADGASSKLMQTPLTVEQPPVQLPSATERPSSAASISSKRSSKTMLSKHSIENGWNYIKRTGRKSEASRSPPATARSMSSTSLERVDEDDKDENGEKRKSSRASRLLKRMSGLSSSSRKNGAESGSDRQSQRNSATKDKKKASSTTPAGFSVGEINVQFPDTLLWKRRWVEVDSMGNLVLGAAAGERTRGEKKKFHLRDFRPALAPSQERQELPHSIMLDFHNGGTLQLAFEDPIGQTTILRKLLDTQSGWTGTQ